MINLQLCILLKNDKVFSMDSISCKFTLCWLKKYIYTILVILLYITVFLVVYQNHIVSKYKGQPTQFNDFRRKCKAWRGRHLTRCHMFLDRYRYNACEHYSRYFLLVAINDSLRKQIPLRLYVTPHLSVLSSIIASPMSH